MGFFGKARARFFRKKSSLGEVEASVKEYDDVCGSRDNSSAFLVPLPHGADAEETILVKKDIANTAQLEDLADEHLPKNEVLAASLCQPYVCVERQDSSAGTSPTTTASQTAADASGQRRRSLFKKAPPLFPTNEDASATVDPGDPLAIIRKNLPPDVLLSTPFGMRRLTYADYTASGRSLRFVEEYIARVVGPLYANTHTETSATGLQTTHFREEARSIILKSLHADPQKYSLIFTGTGVTGAIWKLIALLGIHCPPQLQPFLDMTHPDMERPLILCGQSEHHSNELMWRETIADVIAIPSDDTGSLDLVFLRRILQENKEKYKLIIGSFTAGSNVTGLTTKPGPVADLMHEFGGYCCMDYAGAGPYKDMRMSLPKHDNDTNGNGGDATKESYLDAIFISPHKFVGGPGTPGLLCIRRDFANVRNGIDAPPTIAGGGTVTMVAPDDVGDTQGTKHSYESILHVREEAGTPGVVESIRCGMAFYVRDMVGPLRIEELEGIFAKNAVERLQASNVWVMGDAFSHVTSTSRLSITSFNIWAKIPGLDTNVGQEDVPAGTLVNPESGKPLMLHFHFVAALLNDVYGIQARSGCACAGPLSFRLFGPRFPFMTKRAIDELFPLAESDFHSLKPGFCRVNFNYFIEEEEFEYILKAIEQIAEHGWKLLPLYSLCLKTGQYWFNGLVEGTQRDHKSFNRFDAVRRINEIEFQSDGSVAWKEPRFSTEDRNLYLEEAKKIYDDAPNLVRKMLFRFRDLRKRNMKFPEKFQEFRFFALGSEVLPHLGITEQEMDVASQSALAKNDETNPMIVSYPKHPTANPWFTMDRPRG